MIKKILEEKREEEVAIKGWVITNRGNDKVRFINMNDGSCFENIQIVLKGENAISGDNARIGSAIEVKGVVKLTPSSEQDLEIISSEFKILSITDESYPIQKNGISKEVLRENLHVRHRTNLFRAIMRIRSTLALELHSFFSSKNFMYLNTPIITTNDGEGAGEVFVLKTLKNENFFSEDAFLTVTGQLHAEAYANGFGNVYTFGPTFRAENSNTSRHASEFWMLEPEMAFYDLNKTIYFAEEMLKRVIKNTLEKHIKEFEFLVKFVDKELVTKLTNFTNSKLVIMDYKEVIEKLKPHASKFDNKTIEFGIDLATEHEKFLCEEIINGPVAVINYPKDIKAFYMKQNDDNITVAAFDLLVPGVGEMIGGSQRECNYNKMLTRVQELKINEDDLKWYLDLRKFGQAESSGFGLGFERLIMYVTGIENIRDTIPFPRTPGSILY